MDKRKLKATSTPADIEEWTDAVLKLPRDEIVKYIVDVADQAGIKITDDDPEGYPSFSVAKWPNLAEKFGLASCFENNVFERVITPVYNLPPSVHENMFEAAWRSQDVYQELPEQRRQITRLRIMDPYLVHILGLFQGRVIDKPEERMMETQYPRASESGASGEVEHKIRMIGGTLFCIAEFKLVSGIHQEDCVTQLFLEILSAAESNKQADFADLRIYGLLTDATCFCFYSYDPLTETFAHDISFVVDITRKFAFTDMIPVCNKIFGVILTAYIDGLDAKLSKSREKAKMGNPPNQPPIHSHVLGGCISTDSLEIALQFAQECCDKFNESVDLVDDIKEKSTAALNLLAKSVWSIPRVSYLTGSNDPSSPEELMELAHHMVNKKYLDMIIKKSLS